MLNVVKHLEKVSCKVRANERNVKLVYNFSASAAELNDDIKSQRGILDFSPFGVDLKVHDVQDDRDSG